MTLARRVWIGWLRFEFRALAVVLPLVIALLAASTVLVALYLRIGPIGPGPAGFVALVVGMGVGGPSALLLGRPALRLAAEIG